MLRDCGAPRWGEKKSDVPLPHSLSPTLTCLPGTLSQRERVRERGKA